VAGCGRDPQPLLADGHGRVVDSLDVDIPVLEKEIASLTRNLSVADEDGDDVRRVRHNGNVARGEGVLDGAGVELLEVAVALVGHLVLDGRLGAGHGGGREGGGEDEARREGADGVDHAGGAGDVAADAAVGFAEGAGDDVDAVHDRALGAAGGVRVVVEVFGDAGAVWSVHAYRVHFVEEGGGAVLFGQVAYLGDRADGAAHAVDGFEGNDLGNVDGERGEFGLEIGDVVVLEDHLLGARVPDALDHGGVVHAVGKDDTVGEFAAERCESGVVGYVAGGEDQCGLFGVKLSDGGLESHGMLVVTGDVSGTACSGSVHVERLMHSLQYLWVSTHTKIVVGTPDGDTLVSGRHMGLGKFLSQPIDVVEVAVGLVLVLLVELGIVEAFVIKLRDRGSRGFESESRSILYSLSR